jgi:hypothetical protein
VTGAFSRLFNDVATGSSPKDAEAVFEKFDFDPNGPSENDVIMSHPRFAYYAYKARDEAFAATAAAYPGDPAAWNNEADAFRHAYVNFRMTKDMGVDAAKMFADAHERYSGNKIGETMMDLHNNHMGRQLASNAYLGSLDPTYVIKKAISTGLLQTSPSMFD